MTAFSLFRDGSSCRSVELQGPRPAPLLLQKASHTIKKSPGPCRKPLVIHVVSPKVIHVAPGEFMSMVQRLTGPPAAGSSSSSSLQPPTTALKAGNGRQLSPSRWSPAIGEGIRSRLPQGPQSFQINDQEAHTRPSDLPQSPSWYDFFVSPSSAVDVSSAVLPSPGPYIDISCRVTRET